MRRTVVRLMLAISLGALLPACSGSEESSEKSLDLNPIESKGRIARILIQKGPGNDPNVCVIKADGDTSCQASNQKLPWLPGLNNLGPLKDADGSCFLTKNGSLVCGVSGTQTIVQNKNYDLKAIRMLSGNRLCAISDIDGPDAARCFLDSASTTGLDLLDAHPNIAGNPDAALVQIDSAELTPNGDVLFCGLTLNGKLACAQIAPNNSIRKPYLKLPAVPGVRDFALSSQNLCTVNGNRELSCYRISDAQPSPIPADVPATNVVDLTGTDNTICARYGDGDFRCWTPSAVYSRARFNVLEKAEKVEANRFGICAVFADESVRCLEPVSGSVVSYEGDKASFLQAFGQQTCSVDSQGKLRCWNSSNAYTPPARLNVISGNEFTVGRNHLCFVNGTSISCQGLNTQGQLNVPTFPAAPVSVKASAQHSCGLDRSGKVLCWGDNSFGQLNVPLDLPPAQKIFAGPKMNCAMVRPAGQTVDQLRCWGDPEQVALVPADANLFRELAIGENHACAIRRDKTLSCWGPNNAGQVQRRFILQAQSIAVGQSHSCAVLSDRSLACWGDDRLGQSSVPANLGPVRRVVAGDNHSCAITQSGRVRCWGQREAGLKAKAEKESGSRMREFYPVRARSPGQKQKILSCLFAPCPLPEEPVISFAGYDYTINPHAERYSMELEYSVKGQCPKTLRFVVNGLLPLEHKEKVDTVAHTVKTLYPALKPGVGVNDFRMSGPVFIQLRNLDPVKGLTTTLPSLCEITLEKLLFNPEADTIDNWKRSALVLAANLDEELDEYIADAKERNEKIVEKGEMKTLLTIIKDEFIKEVMEFMAISAQNPETLISGFNYNDNTEDRLSQDLLFTALIDPLFGPYPKLKDIADQPEWFKQIQFSDLQDPLIDVNRATNQFTQAVIAIESGIRFSAEDLASATRDLLGTKLKRAFDKARTFLDETQQLSNQLQNPRGLQEAQDTIREKKGPNTNVKLYDKANQEIYGP